MTLKLRALVYFVLPSVLLGKWYLPLEIFDDIITSNPISMIFGKYFPFITHSPRIANYTLGRINALTTESRE